MIRKLSALAMLVLGTLVPAAARAAWHQASSEHFVIYSDDDPARIRTFAIELERFDRMLRLLWLRPDRPIHPSQRVNIYVVDGIAEVRRLTDARNAAGFYQPRAGGSNAFVPRLAGDDRNDLGPRNILFHEYAHHFMLTEWPDAAYPSWFVEGFAELVATARFDGDGALVLGRPPQYRAAGLFRGRPLPLAKLLADEVDHGWDEEVSALYAWGWALMHYTVVGRPDLEDARVRYLGAINEGRSAREASAAFGDVRALERSLNTYVRGRLAAYRIPAEKLPAGVVELRPLRPGEAAIMDVRMRSAAGVDRRSAPGVHADARRIAAFHPQDPTVQATLAEAAYDARDLAAAETAADRAIAADPANYDARLHKARARMQIARQAGDRRPETWKAIRALIVAANRVDDSDPRAPVLYYRSFAAAGIAPTQAAIDGLYSAFRLGPQDGRLRYEAGVALIDSGRLDLARRTLVPLAHAPHARATDRMAKRLLAAIDAGRAAEVLAQIRGEAVAPEARDD